MTRTGPALSLGNGLETHTFSEPNNAENKEIRWRLGDGNQKDISGIFWGERSIRRKQEEIQGFFDPVTEGVPMANPRPSPLPPARDSVGSGRWQPVTVMDPGSGPGKTGWSGPPP